MRSVGKTKTRGSDLSKLKKLFPGPVLGGAAGVHGDQVREPSRKAVTLMPAGAQQPRWRPGRRAQAQ